MIVLALPARASADTIIANERAPSKVSAEINRVLWSSYDPATGDYSLMSRLITGEITRLPIAPRKVPFDVDDGYLGEGAEVAAYSRCAKEPRLTGGGSAGLLPDYATGRGCDIYLYDFDTQRETKYAPASRSSTSEFLPSASAANRVAFARVYERRHGRRGKVPYLYAIRNNHSPRRLPGGPRGTTGLPGPTSLDLNGPRLAFAWDSRPSGHGNTESDIRLDIVRGSNRTLQSIRGGLTARTLFTPSISLQQVLWGQTTFAGAGGRSDFVYDADSVRGSRKTVQGPNFLLSAAGLPSFGGTYYVTTQSPTATGPASQAPACSPPPATAYPATCVVGRTDPLTFGP
jgi:hypothetical protein